MQIKAKLKISVILCLVLTEVKSKITGSLVPGRGARSIPRSKRIHRTLNLVTDLHKLQEGKKLD